MQYSPKLKKAMVEIIQVLKHHDIGGMIAIHTPGFSEYGLHLNTSYSVAKITGDEIKVRAKIQEDYNGDVESWKKDVADTLNMLELLGLTSGQLSLQLLELSDDIGKKVGASHDLGDHSSHTEQNN